MLVRLVFFFILFFWPIVCLSVRYISYYILFLLIDPFLKGDRVHFVKMLLLMWIEISVVVLLVILISPVDFSDLENNLLLESPYTKTHITIFCISFSVIQLIIWYIIFKTFYPSEKITKTRIIIAIMIAFLISTIMNIPIFWAFPHVY